MSYIIKSPDDLKDPFLCYCIFKRFEAEAGEDFIDYNERIIISYPFIFWLNGRGDITREQLEELAETPGLTIQDVFDETLFPNTYGNSTLSEIKKYTLLAEYICQLSTFRHRLWNAVNDSADFFKDGRFYRNEDGISLACIIEDEDITGENIHYDDVFKMDLSDFWNLSYKERFNLGLEMSVEQSDTMTKAERKYEGYDD